MGSFFAVGTHTPPTTHVCIIMHFYIILQLCTHWITILMHTVCNWFYNANNNNDQAHSVTDLFNAHAHMHTLFYDNI